MAWLEKRLRGAKVWIRSDEQGLPQSGPDNRVEIVYRPGGKPYRAALANLLDLPDAKPLSDAEMLSIAPAEAATGPAQKPPKDPILPGVQKVARAPQQADAVHVYTDGACTGNPGPMGIGVVLLDALADAEARRELSEYLGNGTNNIAELTAIKRALDLLPRDRPAVIYTDSSYSIGVLSQGWRARANQELILQIRQQLGEFRRVSFVKVAGHAGIPENERCDELARLAIERRRS